MASRLKHLFLLLVVVSAIMCKGGESGILPSKTLVQIINSLPSHEDVTVHCKDKNHDLGEHTVKSGEMYEFRFRPNPFTKVTLYFCSFWWPSLNKPHYFDIYKQERDTCTQCPWKVTDYGPCLYGIECHPWNPPMPYNP